MSVIASYITLASDGLLSYSYSIRHVVISCLMITTVLHCSISAQPTITVRTDRQEIRIGEQVELNIEVAHDAKIFMTWPSIAEKIGEMEIAKRTAVDTFSTERGYKEICSYWITAFEEGEYELPDLAFKYRSRDEVIEYELMASLPIIKVNTIAIDTSSGLRPVHAPIPIKLGVIDYWLELAIAAACIVLIAFLVWIIKRRKNRAKPIQETIIIPPTPHEWALDQLNRLEAEKRWQSGLVKDYYTGLTDIFRTYLEKRFDIQAMESTTDEIITILQKNPEASQNIEELAEILSIADYVKFAKGEPAINFHTDALLKVRSYIHKTKSNTAS